MSGVNDWVSQAEVALSDTQWKTASKLQVTRSYCYSNNWIQIHSWETNRVQSMNRTLHHKFLHIYNNELAELKGTTDI